MNGSIDIDTLAEKIACVMVEDPAFRQTVVRRLTGLLTTTEAAGMLRLTPAYLPRFLAKNGVSPVYLTGRAPRWKLTEIEALIERLRTRDPA